jgi:imidazolonepropionase-like amidohydrolase
VVRRSAVGAVSLAVAALATVPALAVGQTVAITGATIYPVSGPKVERGTIVIRDGRIAAIGASVAVPSGATRIDATGRWITPGFIQSGTGLGLRLLESGGTNQTRENELAGDATPAFNVAEGIDPASITIPVARLEGITSTLGVPEAGLIPGQGVFFDLAGDRIEAMLAKSPAAMVIDVSESGKNAAGGSRAGIMQRLRQILRDAAEYERRKADYRRAQMQPLSLPEADLQALQPVLRGELPVLAKANRRSDIENALRLAREFKLRLVIWGGVEAWQVAPELAAARVPVVVEPLTDVPRFDALGARLDNATLLRAGGASVVLAQHDAANFRNLRQAAGNAVRNGLAWEDALRAVTLGAAEAFGVADRYGSLEVGKVANVVVWTGDPFEFSSEAERVFIRGQEMPRTSRQIELRDRYSKLPPKF